jgi:hypothetical protein
MPDPAEKEKNSPVSKDNSAELKQLKAELATSRENEGRTRGNLTKVQKKVEKLTAQLAEKTATTSPKGTDTLATTPTTATTTVVPASSATSTIASNATAASSPSETHVAKWEPPYCPDCGGANESFKNQVKCANCGAPLGSEEYAKHTMKVCPLCGTASGWKPVGDYQPVHTGCTGPECKLIQVKA